VRGRLLNDVDDATTAKLPESVIEIDSEECAMTTAVIESNPVELVLNANGLRDAMKVNLKVADLSSAPRNS